MQSESTDKEQSLLDHLQCPVCLDYMTPPIILCENGHKICNICDPKVNSCPTCRGRFSLTRNLALEDLTRHVMYPCKYRSYGCKETFNYDKIAGHQASCLYTPQVCPVAKLAIGTCSWTGNYKDIKAHLKENHFEGCCEYVEGDVKFIYNLTGGLDLFCFIFAYNEVFFSLFEERDNIFYAVVLYVGPAENAAKYKYRVEFINNDNTEGVTVMHLTRSSGQDLEDVRRSGACGKLLYDVVCRLKDEEDNVEFKFNY